MVKIKFNPICHSRGGFANLCFAFKVIHNVAFVCLFVIQLAVSCHQTMVGVVGQTSIYITCILLRTFDITVLLRSLVLSKLLLIHDTCNNTSLEITS